MIIFNNISAYFVLISVENDHNFKQNEDRATVILKWTDFSKYWIRITVYGLPRLKWWNLLFYIIWLFTKLEEARATVSCNWESNSENNNFGTYSRITKLLFMYLCTMYISWIFKHMYFYFTPKIGLTYWNLLHFCLMKE